ADEARGARTADGGSEERGGERGQQVPAGHLGMARTELRGQHHCRERREDAGDHERDERVADHAEIGTTTALVDGIATYQTSCDGAGENSTHVRDGGCSVSLREKGPSSTLRRAYLPPKPPTVRCAFTRPRRRPLSRLPGSSPLSAPVSCGCCGGAGCSPRRR